ncbi:MAG: clostripain-related cysteine peptidase [Candidatus Sericytochromatia bacterium]
MEPKPQEQNNGRMWTVAVYMAADSNIYPYALEDINEMEAGLARLAKGSAQLEVLVLMDGSPVGDSKVLRIRPDPGPVNTKIISEVLDDQGAVIPASKEVDTGDQETLRHFGDYVTDKFPATHHALVLWQHHNSLRPVDRTHRYSSSFFNLIGSLNSIGERRPGAASTSFAVDDHGGALLLSDLNPILASARKILGRSIDILGFDTDQMQHLETAYQIKDLAGILVASEDIEPGRGWAYDVLLARLSTQPDMEPSQLARIMVDSFVQSFEKTGNAATLTALDVHRTSMEVVPALNALAAELKAHLPAETEPIRTARLNAQRFYASDAIDLGDFLKQYAQSQPPVRIFKAMTRLQQTMEGARISHRFTGLDVQKATGYQIYFPPANQGYDTRYDDPRQFRFAEINGWREFLKTFAQTEP